MERFVRWIAAALATAAAFAVPTWICGALLLPLVVKDPAIRWGLASALGVAMAALAALWGHDFATRAQEETGDRESPGPVVKASGERAAAVGGNNSGTISTGDQHRGAPS